MSNPLHSGYQHPVTRGWQKQSNELTKQSLIYPVFIHEKQDVKEEIAALPGQYRYGINTIKESFAPLVKKGLSSILLFGVPGTIEKDERGTGADLQTSPVIQAIKIFRKEFPHVLVCCDVCMCAYTSHGHCGIMNEDLGGLDNELSINRLAEISLNFVKAGCQLIAPSDMMDGRILAIKNVLIRNGYGNRVPVMSYSAKFASSFYGPFRHTAGSAPSYGDRKCYQLPIHARGLAKRALQRDANEGADMLMVKPGLPYLDIVRDARSLFPDIPIAIYQVSGEYAMLWHGAQHNVVDLREGVIESLECCLRAGIFL
jgi:porphobilinogen synthase